MILEGFFTNFAVCVGHIYVHLFVVMIRNEAGWFCQQRPCACEGGQAGRSSSCRWLLFRECQPAEAKGEIKKRERGGSASLLTAKYSPLSKYGPCPFHHPDNISSLKFRCCGTQLFGYIRARRKMILRIFSLPYRSAAAIETANILRDWFQSILRRRFTGGKKSCAHIYSATVFCILKRYDFVRSL